MIVLTQYVLQLDVVEGTHNLNKATALWFLCCYFSAARVGNRVLQVSMVIITVQGKLNVGVRKL